MPETDIEAIRTYWSKRALDFDQKYNELDVRKAVAKRVVVDLSRINSASGSRLTRLSFEFDGCYSSYC